MNKSFFKSKTIKKRKERIRDVKPFILIVCEGERTEPNYFKSFKILSKDVLEIDIKGEGRNTLDLVEQALVIKRDNEKKKEIIYDQVWVVFDRDSFPHGQFNSAIKKARSNGLRVAYSNECFEVWYYLHFSYRETSKLK